MSKLPSALLFISILLLFQLSSAVLFDSILLLFQLPSVVLFISISYCSQLPMQLTLPNMQSLLQPPPTQLAMLNMQSLLQPPPIQLTMLNMQSLLLCVITHLTRRSHHPGSPSMVRGISVEQRHSVPLSSSGRCSHSLLKAHACTKIQEKCPMVLAPFLPPCP